MGEGRACKWNDQRAYQSCSESLSCELLQNTEGSHNPSVWLTVTYRFSWWTIGYSHCVVENLCIGCWAGLTLHARSMLCLMVYPSYIHLHGHSQWVASSITKPSHSPKHDFPALDQNSKLYSQIPEERWDSVQERPNMEESNIQTTSTAETNWRLVMRFIWSHGHESVCCRRGFHKCHGWEERWDAAQGLGSIAYSPVRLIIWCQTPQTEVYCRIHRVTNHTVDTNDDEWAFTHYNGIPVEEIYDKRKHDSDDSLNREPFDNKTPLQSLEASPGASTHAATAKGQPRWVLRSNDIRWL